ncbi:MAG: D-alanyl-D-alanine carboxypeptidase [Alphaproteobacteria bacterium]|nr:D-alanyl-D-alanine carboxypeptidase [Alphaproteobacteria bacterium]
MRQSIGAGILCLALWAALTVPARAIPQLLMDMRTGEVLFENEAGQPWYPASLTKLMTAYVAFEAIASGRATLDTPIIMSATARKAPPARLGVPVGTALRLEDALYMLIVKSANDVATAIAETLSGSEREFVAEMNLNAAVLGLTGTRYANANGLFDPDQKTTARDLAILALTIFRRYPQYAPIFATSEVQFGKTSLESQNDLLERFEGATGMKTGYICASGLNIVATANRDGRRLMAIVLGGVSARERGEMAASLLAQGFAGRTNRGGRVDAIENLPRSPVNMRPRLCGAEARPYMAERKTSFPAGLNGQPSFLGEKSEGRVVRVTTLGDMRDVPWPRARPAYDFVPPTPDPNAEPVPLPHPRPH